MSEQNKAPIKWSGKHNEENVTLTLYVSMPFEAGHELTEEEAGAFNQYRRQMINNWVRGEQGTKAIVTALGDGATQDALQEIVTNYDDNYQFGKRSVGGGGMNSLDREIAATAMAYLRYKRTDITKGKKAAEIRETEEYKKLITMPKIIEFATAQLAKREAEKQEQLAALSDIQE